MATNEGPAARQLAATDTMATMGDGLLRWQFRNAGKDDRASIGDVARAIGAVAGLLGYGVGMTDRDERISCENAAIIQLCKQWRVSPFNDRS